MTLARGGDPAIRPVGADQVFLADHVRAIEVGINPEERGVRQRVRFDVALDVSARAAPDEAGARPAVSYDLILGVIDELTEQRRTGLLETLAERLAGRLLAHPAVVRVHVRLEKLDRLGGAGQLGVAMVRERADGAGAGGPP